MTRIRLAALLLALPAVAPAAAPRNSISNELGLGAGRVDPRNPRSGQVSDVVMASVDAGSGWSLDLAAALTFVGAIEGTRQAFGSSGGDTAFFGVGASYEASDHVTAGLMLGFSPSSSVLADTTVAYSPSPGMTSDIDAQIKATTSLASMRFSLAYDTAGDSDLETGIDFDLGLTHFDGDQRVVRTRDPTTGATVTLADLRAYCLANPASCPLQLLGVYRDRPTPLNQAEFRLGVTETIGRDTDVGLGGSYFIYDRDPTEVGFFDLMTAGRGTSFGAGLPMAPLRWSLRPEVTHRFGAFHVRLWVEHGRYVDDEGSKNLLGIRLEYRFSRTFRMWAVASWQRDEAEGDVTHFNQVSLGTMWLF